MQQAQYWKQVHHSDPRALAMADRHYSRRSPGTPEFIAAGHKIVLMHFLSDGTPAALWASHRADPAADLERPRFDGLDVWDCSLFRVEHRTAPASDLIREAVAITCALWRPLPADGFYTTIDPKKVKPIKIRGVPTWGYCYRKAGWVEQLNRTRRGYIVYMLPCLEQIELVHAVFDLPAFGIAWRRWPRKQSTGQEVMDL